MLIYDIEIANAIPGSGRQREPGVSYCEGWQDYSGMGIAVVGCYDYAADRTRVFCNDNLEEFFALARKTETVVGFNNQRFDDRILAARGCLLEDGQSYDILGEVWRGLGLGPDYRTETHGGFSLQRLCQANFGTPKTGDGGQAPVLWQRHYFGSVIDYCLADVHLTKKLLDRIIRTGQLHNPNDMGARIRVRKPGSAGAK